MSDYVWRLVAFVILFIALPFMVGCGTSQGLPPLPSPAPVTVGATSNPYARADHLMKWAQDVPSGAKYHQREARLRIVGDGYSEQLYYRADERAGSYRGVPPRDWVRDDPRWRDWRYHYHHSRRRW